MNKPNGRPIQYDRNKITELWSQGISKKEIAAKLGCNWRTVHRVIKIERI